jgi:prepilin-type N-terminal cleavage/methylation domain-containing protein
MNSPQHRSPNNSQGFTLIELLTVIAIIGILAAIIIPTVGSVRNSAKSSRALSNAKQTGMATLLYAQEARGVILAHGDGNSGFAYSEQMYRQWVAYLAKRLSNVVLDNAAVLQQYSDPFLPDNFTTYGNYGTTWTINRIFNVHAGRSVQTQGAPYNSTPRPRTINEFLEPSRTIYAVSGGGYEISATNIVDAALVNPPVARQALYYFHKNGKATPVVFLDGHTALLSFPIDPRLTQMKDFN